MFTVLVLVEVLQILCLRSQDGPVPQHSVTLTST